LFTVTVTLPDFTFDDDVDNVNSFWVTVTDCGFALVPDEQLASSTKPEAATTPARRKYLIVGV